MLIAKEEVRFDFKGASFDTTKPEERKLLGWVFDQFLYGEVTGIQCGHWLYHAPHLNAAAFLAKQAGEEISHVRRILRIFSLLGEKPNPPHPVIKFLSTGMMGGSWGEHVALEMALGEGLVLSVFYAMADTIPDPEIKKIIETASVEEERHVEFGERETVAWLKENPRSRKYLFAQALVQVVALSLLKRFVLKKVLKGTHADHPVLRQFPQFYDHVLAMFSRRIELLGLSTRPLSEMSRFEKVIILGQLPFRQLASKLSRRSPLLTSTYLRDPVLEAELQRSLPGRSAP